ncbi:DUF4355 domain-containing protein [Clostridium botulinum]|uniref:DUF4355 domain-containing protein n=1 Tax=Clostridium botulinum TaxID=1491 RepID=A0A6M0SN37_CLOBO|nr:DUF4355 domain-containing protein [Clostridium botulinum]
MELKDVKNFLETNAEGKQWLQSYTDGKVTKAIDIWKSNNLQGEVDNKVKELYPDEDPKDKALKELKAEIEGFRKENTKKDILSQVTKSATDKSLPIEIVKMLISDDLDSTNNNIKVLEEVWTKSLKENVNSKIEPYVPKSGTGNNGQLDKSSFIKMSYQDKKQLKQDNPDIYNSLVNS